MSTARTTGFSPQPTPHREADKNEHAADLHSLLASQLKLDAHWMPFSANRNFQRDPRLIVAAEGSWLIDDQGRRIYDSLSGLWTCGAGHSRKEIQEAVAKQLGTLDYSPVSSSATRCPSSWPRRSPA